MEVTVYGPLRGVTVDATVTIEYTGETVDDALEALVEAYPGLERHLYRDDGTLESSVRLLVDGTRVAPDDPCPPDATLQLHPPVHGG